MDAPQMPPGVIAAARGAVKAHLRTIGTGEDALIERHAASALALCEAFTGQAVILREHVDPVAADGIWRRLGAAPVAAITRVTGADDVVPDAGAFAIDIDARREGWVRASMPGRVARVTYDAGLASAWDGLPPPLAQGVVLLAAHLLNGATVEPPAAVTALWRPWRRMRVRGGGDART